MPDDYRTMSSPFLLLMFAVLAAGFVAMRALTRQSDDILTADELAGLERTLRLLDAWTGHDRVKALERLLAAMPKRVPVRHALAVIEPLQGADRRDALLLLVPRLPRVMPSDIVDVLVRPLDEADAKRVRSALAKHATEREAQRR